MAQSLILDYARGPGMAEIDGYLRAGGYESARRALTGEWTPDDVIAQIELSGLRGKGGAGFPTGRKWKFIPKDAPVKYVVVNADEGEPGTFKDRTLIECAPHLLIEGIIICAYAIGAHEAYVYLRKEFYRGRRLLDRAVAQARERGFLGRGIFDSGFDLDVVVHSGAGAYIAGEESALLESLEGRRALPRLRPPYYPAVMGLYYKPTALNNVETLCHVPRILAIGPKAYEEAGPPALFSVSGHVRRPGVYERPLGITLGELIDAAGGLRPGRHFKAAFPGGSSSAIVAGRDALDQRMDYESLRVAGTMLGSAAVIVMDDSTDIVRVVARAVEFYRDESCGKCTPCREGTIWLGQIYERILHGRGRAEDLALIESVSGHLLGGTCFCPLGESVPPSVLASLKYFRSEYDHYIAKGEPLVAAL